MIIGTKTAVIAVRRMTDKAARLPMVSLPCPRCGKQGPIAIVDDDNDGIRCGACGHTMHAGEMAATLRVYRERKRKDGTWQCEALAVVEGAVKAARALPADKRTKDEATLAAVDTGKAEPIAIETVPR